MFVNLTGKWENAGYVETTLNKTVFIIGVFMNTVEIIVNVTEQTE